MITKGKVEYIFRRSRQKVWHFIEDSYRTSFQDIQRENCVNSKEIRVLGLRRSGNHAIINWIRSQLPKNTVFINHTRVRENPYRNVYEDQLFLSRNPQLKGWRCEDIDWWKKEAKGHFSPKDCLIYSFEDQEIAQVAHHSFEKMHDIYLGQSSERFDVIVIRDPFNLFASRLQGNKPRANARNFDLMNVYSRHHNLPELWVTYAKECLNETTFLRHNKVVINYNQWFSDCDYRQQIADLLGLTFSDAGFTEVVRAGGIGSSFDGINFNNDAASMDVLNRWKRFEENPFFLDLLKTPELVEYSVRLFGHLPEIDKLLELL